MNPVRIKVCGITRAADAKAADALGVDALGFVFVKRSKRFTSIENAASVSNEVGPFIQRVGLFLDDDKALVEQALATIPGLIPQFHGQETADYCDQFGRPYLKAIGVAGGMPEASVFASYRLCAGFLFDSNAPGALGGTGHTFDWDCLESADSAADIGHLGGRLILAGGLAPDNVAEAIARVRPYAVDVSSGVEESAGIKDHALMADFVAEVRSAVTGKTAGNTVRAATPR